VWCSVLAALAATGVSTAIAGARPTAARSRNAVSLSAPVSIGENARLKLVVRYTAIEDDRSPALLWVGYRHGSSACPVVIAAGATFTLIESGAEVTGTAAKTYREPAPLAPGEYRFCAWLTDAQTTILVGPASVLVRVTAPARPPVEESYTGRTSNGQRFGLGVLGRSVIGFSFQAKLPCTGTHPEMTYVDWDRTVENIRLPISRSGLFQGTAKTSPGNTTAIRGRLSGRHVSGTLTDVLKPVRASQITLEAPPHALVTGGVCRAMLSFSATLRR